MYWIPIIGSILEASGMTVEKKVMRKHKINAKNFTVYGFLANVLIMLPFIYFFWRVDPIALQPLNLLIFFAVVVLSIFANLSIFYALKRETVTEMEPIRLMQPLFTIVLAFLFSVIFQGAYASEKNIEILVLALIASITLIATHVRKHHLVINKYIIAALIGSFLFSLELVISRAILDYYNPLSFYFIRCLFVFLLTWMMFHPHIRTIKNKTKIMIFIGGAIWIVYRMILYYSYVQLGVVLTTMILSILAPIFVYIFANLFLKEKINLRHIISSIVIVACVVAAIILSQ